VLLGIGGEIFVKPAFLRLARHDDSAIVSAFYQLFDRVQFKTAFLLKGTVALDAVYIEERLHFARPKYGCIRCARDLGGSKKAPKSKDGFAAHVRVYFTSKRRKCAMSFSRKLLVLSAHGWLHPSMMSQPLYVLGGLAWWNAILVLTLSAVPTGRGP
jgi:hypothetical protein